MGYDHWNDPEGLAWAWGRAALWGEAETLVEVGTTAEALAVEALADLAVAADLASAAGAGVSVAKAGNAHNPMTKTKTPNLFPPTMTPILS